MDFFPVETIHSPFRLWFIYNPPTTTAVSVLLTWGTTSYTFDDIGSLTFDYFA
jgi:hypothetical protein